MAEGYILYEDAKTRFDNCIEGIDFYYNKRILHREGDDPKYYFVVDNQMPVPKEELILEVVAK